MDLCQLVRRSQPEALQVQDQHSVDRKKRYEHRVIKSVSGAQFDTTGLTSIITGHCGREFVMDVKSLTLAGSEMKSAGLMWWHRTHTYTPTPSPAEQHRNDMLSLLHWIYVHDSITATDPHTY